jgi:hypothetical protein
VTLRSASAQSTTAKRKLLVLRRSLEGRPVPAKEPAPESAGGDSDGERRRVAREAVWRATKASAGKAGKLSVAAARFGGEKIRNLNKVKIRNLNKVE